MLRQFKLYKWTGFCCQANARHCFLYTHTHVWWKREKIILDCSVRQRQQQQQTFRLTNENVRIMNGTRHIGNAKQSPLILNGIWLAEEREKKEARAEENNVGEEIAPKRPCDSQSEMEPFVLNKWKRHHHQKPSSSSSLSLARSPIGCIVRSFNANRFGKRKCPQIKYSIYLKRQYPLTTNQSSERYQLFSFNARTNYKNIQF